MFRFPKKSNISLKRKVLLIIAIVLGLGVLGAATYYWISGGTPNADGSYNWNNNANWNTAADGSGTSGIPDSYDSIDNSSFSNATGKTIVITSDIEVEKFTLPAGVTVIINAGCTLASQNGSTINGTLIVNGSYSESGTVTISETGSVTVSETGTFFGANGVIVNGTLNSEGTVSTNNTNLTVNSTGSVVNSGSIIANGGISNNGSIETSEGSITGNITYNGGTITGYADNQYTTVEGVTSLVWTDNSTWVNGAVPNTDGVASAVINLKSDVTAGTLIFNNSDSKHIIINLNGYTLTCTEILLSGTSGSGYPTDIQVNGSGQIITELFDSTENTHKWTMSGGVVLIITKTLYANRATGSLTFTNADGTCSMYVPASGVNVNYGISKATYPGFELQPYGEPDIYKVNISGTNITDGYTIQCWKDDKGNDRIPVNFDYDVVIEDNHGSTAVYTPSGASGVVAVPKDSNSTDLTVKKTSGVINPGDGIIITVYTPDDSGLVLAEFRYIQDEVKWIGNTSTDWNTLSNWNGIANVSELATADVVIPAGCANYPEVSNITVKSLTIKNNARLTVSSGTLSVSNGITCEGLGKLIATSGKVSFTGPLSTWNADYPENSLIKDVVIGSSGVLTLQSDMYITNSFDNSAGGSFDGAANSTSVIFQPESTTATIIGSSDYTDTLFGTIKCVGQGGKELGFTGLISANSLDLTGSNTSSLLTVSGSGSTKIKLPSSVVGGKYLSVKNSSPVMTDGSTDGTYTYTIYESKDDEVDASMPTGWVLGDATDFVWLGKTSSWTSGANWSTGTAPTVGAKVIIPSSGGGAWPVLSSDINLGTGSIEIAVGARLDLAGKKITAASLINNGTLRLTGTETLTSGQKLSNITALTLGSNSMVEYYGITGTTANWNGGDFVNLSISSGSIVIVASDITVKGNFTNNGTATTSSIILSPSGSSSTITGSGSVAGLQCTGKGGKSLYINGAVTITGNTANALQLSGSSTTSRLSIDGSGTFTLAANQTGSNEYLSVENVSVTNGGTNQISVSYSISTSAPTGWTGLTASLTYTWDGSADSDWNTAANWDGNIVPATDGSAIIVIPDVSGVSGSFPVLPSTGVTVTDLTIESGGQLTLNGYSLSVSGIWDNEGTVVASGGESITLPTLASNRTENGTWKYVGAGSLFSGYSFNNLIINLTSSGTVTAASDLTILNDLTIVSANSTLSTSGKLIVSGTLENSGTLTLGGKLTAPTIVNYDQSGLASGVGGSINFGSATAVINSYTGSTAVTPDDKIIISGGSLQNAGSSILEIGILDATTSTTLKGGTNGITVTSASYNSAPAIIASGSVTLPSGTIGALTIGDDSTTSTLTLSGNITVSSVEIKANATLVAGVNAGDAYTISVGGNWTNSNTSGGFTAQNSTVKFTADSILSGSTTFYDFECITAGTILTFTAGTTQTIASGGSFTIRGTSSSFITLTSSSTSAWNIDLTNANNVSVEYADISYSTVMGTSTTAVAAGSKSTNGNNTRWIMNYKWSKTAASTDWTINTNWENGISPGNNNSYAEVIIQEQTSGTNYPVLAAAIIVKELTIDAGASIDFASSSVTASEGITNKGTIKLTGVSSQALPSTITNDSGSTVEYEPVTVGTASTAEVLCGTTYDTLVVDADVTLQIGNNSLIVNTALENKGTIEINDASGSISKTDVDSGTFIYSASGDAVADFGTDDYFNLTITSGGTISIGNPLSVKNRLSVLKGTLALGTNNATVTGNLVVGDGTNTGTLTFDATSGGTLSVAGDVTFTTSYSSLSAGTGTILLTGIGAQSLSTNNLQFYNVTLGDLATTATVTVSGATTPSLTVTGKLEVGTNHVLDLDANDIVLSVTGDTVNNGTITGGAGDLTFTGKTENNGTITGGAGELIFTDKYSGTSANLTASSGTTYFKAAADLSGTAFTHNNGTVTFDGTADQTLTIPGSGSITFDTVVINKATGTFEETGVATFETDTLTLTKAAGITFNSATTITNSLTDAADGSTGTIAFLGNTSITPAVTFNTTSELTLGDGGAIGASADTIEFDGGVTHTTSNTKLACALITTDKAVVFGSLTYGIELTEATSITTKDSSGDAVTLSGAITNTITSRALTIDAGSGAVTFGSTIGGGATPLGDIKVTAAGGVKVASDITASKVAFETGTAVVLTGDSVIKTSDNNGAVSFASTVDSDLTLRDLTIASGTGTVTFSGALGGTSSIDALSSTGTGNVTFGGAVKASSVAITGTSGISGGAITTTSTQEYTGDVTLGADTVLLANSTPSADNGLASTVAFKGTITGSSKALTIGSSSARLTNVTFGDALSDTVTGVAALTVNGTMDANTTISATSVSVSGASQLDGGSIETSVDQKYSGNVTLGVNTTLTSTGGDISVGAVGVGTTATVTSASKTLKVETAANKTTLFSGGFADAASLTITGSADIYGDNTFASLAIDNSTLTTAATTVKFENGKLQTINGSPSFKGYSSTNTLTLASISSGNKWNVYFSNATLPTASNFTYVLVSDSNSVDSDGTTANPLEIIPITDYIQEAILASPSTQNWFINAYYWLGGIDSSWTTATNWAYDASGTNMALVYPPYTGSTSEIVINTATNDLDLADGISGTTSIALKSLTINSDKRMAIGKCEITTSGDITNNGTIALYGTQSTPLTATSPSTITHANGSTIEYYGNVGDNTTPAKDVLAVSTSGTTKTYYNLLINKTGGKLEFESDVSATSLTTKQDSTNTTGYALVFDRTVSVASGDVIFGRGGDPGITENVDVTLKDDFTATTSSTSKITFWGDVTVNKSDTLKITNTGANLYFNKSVDAATASTTSLELSASTKVQFRATETSNDVGTNIVNLTVSKGQTLTTSSAYTIQPSGTQSYKAVENKGKIIQATDKTLTITGDFTNTGTITCSSGEMSVTGDVANSGTITGSSGTIEIDGDYSSTGTAAFTGSSATTTFTGAVDFTNTTFTHNSGELMFGGSSSQTLTTKADGTTAFNNIKVNSGSTVTTDSSFSVANNWTNNGKFTATGGTITFTGTGTALTPIVIAGNATLANSVFYEADVQSDYVTLSGSNTFTTATFSGTKNIELSASNAFATATFSGSSATIHFVDANTFTNLSFTGVNATVKFGAGKTQTVTTALKSVGSTGNEITLTTDAATPSASNNTTWWTLTIPANFYSSLLSGDFQYTKVEYSTSTNNITHDWGATVTENTGASTTNWFIRKFYWYGNSDTAWTTPANWSVNSASYVASSFYPPYDSGLSEIVISDNDSGVLKLSDSTTYKIKTLVVDSGKKVDFNGQTITANSITNNGTILMKGSETLTGVTTKANDSNSPVTSTIEYYGAITNTTFSGGWGTNFSNIVFADGSSGSSTSALTVNGTTEILSDAALSLTGGSTFTGTVTIDAGNAVTLSGSNTISNGVTLTAGGAVAIKTTAEFSLASGASCTSLEVTGAVTLNGDVTTTGSQTYNGAVTLSVDTTLIANSTPSANGGTTSTVTFNGNISGGVAGSEKSLIIGNGTYGALNGASLTCDVTAKTDVQFGNGTTTAKISDLKNLVIFGTTNVTKNYTAKAVGYQLYCGDVTNLGTIEAGGTQALENGEDVHFGGNYSAVSGSDKGTLTGSTYYCIRFEQADSSEIHVKMGDYTHNGGTICFFGAGTGKTYFEPGNNEYNFIYCRKTGTGSELIFAATAIGTDDQPLEQNLSTGGLYVENGTVQFGAAKLVLRALSVTNTAKFIQTGSNSDDGGTDSLATLQRVGSIVAGGTDSVKWDSASQGGSLYLYGDANIVTENYCNFGQKKVYTKADLNLSGAFYDLIIPSGVTVTNYTSRQIRVRHDFTINDGGTYVHNGRPLIIGNTESSSDSVTGGKITDSSTGALQNLGSVTVRAAGQTKVLASSIQIGTLTVASGTLAAGSASTDAHTINVSENLEFTASNGLFTANKSTINLNGAVDQTFTTNAQSFYNVALATTDTAAVTTSGDLTATGALTVNTGRTLNLATNNSELAVTGITINSGIITGGTGSLTFTGATTNTGTITGSSGTLTFTGNYSGASGKLTASSGDTVFTGNSVVFNTTASSFTGNGGTVKLTGSTAQTFNAAAQTLNNVSFENTYSTAGTSLLGSFTATGDVSIATGAYLSAGANTITLNGGNWSNTGTFNYGTGKIVIQDNCEITGSTTFYDFECTTGGTTLTFEAGETQTIASGGSIDIKGSSGNLITLESSAGGTAWLITSTGTNTFDYVDVKDSTNTSTDNFIAKNSKDSGNNVKWNFFGHAYTWVGGNAGNERSWTTKENWSPASVPGTNTVITIPSEKTNYPLLTAALNIVDSITPTGTQASITIDSGATLDCAGQNIKAAVVTNNGTLRFTGVTGQTTNVLTKDNGSGLVEYYGTAIISAAWGTEYYQLKFPSGATGTISTQLNVSDTTTIDAGTGNDLTLSSIDNTFTENLTITSGGDIKLSSDGSLKIADSASCDSLEVIGDATLNGTITTTGTQEYKAAVTLGAGTTLVAGMNTVTFGGIVNGSSFLTIGDSTHATDVAFNGNIGGTTPIGALKVYGDLTAGALVTDITSVSTIAIDGTTSFGATGETTITSSGDQTFSGSVTLAGTTPNATSFVAYDGSTGKTVTFKNTVGGSAARNLDIGASGKASNAVFEVTTGGDGALLGVVTVYGGTTFGKSSGSAVTITTSDAQTYTGASTLVVDTTLISTLTSGDALVLGKVDASSDGGQSLTVTTSSSTGKINFNGVVGSTFALGDITTDGIVNFADDFTQNTTKTFKVTSGSVSVGENRFVAGALQIANGTSFIQTGINTQTDLAITDNYQYVKSLENNGSCSWDSTILGGYITLGGNISGSNASSVAFNHKNVTLGASLTLSGIFYDLTIPNLVNVTNGNGIRVQRNFLIESGGVYTHDSEILTLGGTDSADGTISDDNTTANNLGAVTITQGTTTKTFNTAIKADTLTMSDTTASAGAVTFDGFLTASTLTNGASTNFAITLNDGATITNAVTFNTSGTVTLGNDGATGASADTITFNGGVTHTAGDTKLACALVTSDDAVVFGSSTYGIELTNATSITTKVASGGDVTLNGAITNETTSRALTIASGSGAVLFGSTVGGGATPLGDLEVTSSSTITANNTVNSTKIKLAGGTVDLNGAVTATNGFESTGTTFDNTGATITTTDSAITINQSGAITVAAALSSGADSTGDITVTSSNGTMSISGNITSGTGKITIAGTSATSPVAISGTVNSTTGDIDIDSTYTLGITNTITSTTGNVTIDSTNVATLSDVADIKTTTGNVTFGATKSGSVSTAGNITTAGVEATPSGAVTFNQATTLTGDITITTNDNSSAGGKVLFASTVDSDLTIRDLTITSGTGTVTFSGALGGTSFIDVLSSTGTGNVTFGGAIKASSVTIIGTSDINGGSITTTGTQSYTGAVTLGDNTTLTSTGSGAITIGNDSNPATVTGSGKSLTVATDGTVTFYGAIGASDAILGNISQTGDGAVTFKGVIYSGDITDSGSGDVTFSSAVHAAAISDSGTGDVTFSGTVNATTINITGNTTFAGIVEASSVEITGTTAINTTLITTTSTQTYTGNVTLGADAELKAFDPVTSTDSTVLFKSKVDGDSHSLKITGDAEFGDGTGSDTVSSLTTLSVSGTTTVNTGASITTTGSQTYSGDVTNEGTITGSSELVTFAGDVTNTSGIITSDSGGILFNGSITDGDLNGASGATITMENSNSKEFNPDTFTHNGCSFELKGSGDLSLPTPFTYYDFVCETPDKVIKFATGTLANTATHHIVVNVFIITGADGHLIELIANDNLNTYWYIQTVVDKTDVKYASIEYSYSINSIVDRVASNSKEKTAGTTVNWFRQVYTWKGSSNSDWTVASNWRLGGDASISIANSPTGNSNEDIYVIDNNTDSELNLASSYSYPHVLARSFTIKKGATINLADKDLIVEKDIVNNGTVILDGDSDQVISTNNGTISNGIKGDSNANDFGSTVQYENAAATYPVWGSNYCNLTVSLDPSYVFHVDKDLLSTNGEISFDSPVVLDSSAQTLNIISTLDGTVNGTLSGEIYFSSDSSLDGVDTDNPNVVFKAKDILINSQVGSSKSLNEISMICEKLTINKSINAASMSVTNSGLFLTEEDADITLSSGSFEQLSGGDASKVQLAGGIITTDVNSINFTDDVYLVGTDTELTLGGGTGSISVGTISNRKNLYVLTSYDKTVNINSPFICDNFALFSGKISLGSDCTNLETTSDMILLNGLVDNSTSSIYYDATTIVQNLYAYQNENRVSTTEGNTSGNTAQVSLESFPTVTPDENTSILHSGTNSYANLKTYAGSFVDLSGKTITIGKNFYANGVELAGTATWYLKIPDNDKATTSFAEAYNTTVSNCTVQNTTPGGICAVVSAAENCIDNGNNTGWDFTRPIILANDSTKERDMATVTEGSWTANLSGTYTVYDDVIRVEFADNKATIAAKKIENSNNEISKAISNIKFNNGNLVFTGSFVDADCTQTTDGKGDLSVFYIKTNGTSTQRWNTDATGVNIGAAQSTDRGRQEELSATRNILPNIEIPKALTTVYATLKDEHKNRIGHYVGNPATQNYDLDGDGTNDSNSSAVAMFTAVADRTSPVLVAVHTGQELHDMNAAIQAPYDSHNFIELSYSEQVDIGDIPSIITAGNEENLQNIKASSQFDSLVTHGGAINTVDSSLQLVGFANIESGSLSTGSRTSDNVTIKAEDNEVHALYRYFTSNLTEGQKVQTHKIRFSIAGYCSEQVSIQDKLVSYWPGFIDSSVSPTGRVTRVANSFIVDKSTASTGGNALSIIGQQSDDLVNHSLPTIQLVNDSLENTLYGKWDTLSPVIASYSGLNSWAENADDASFEIIGVSLSNGIYTEQVELHFFDNEQKYLNTDEYQWVTRRGWITNPSSPTDIQRAYDVSGGSRSFTTLPEITESNKTLGGIRTSSLFNSLQAFTYSYQNATYNFAEEINTSITNETIFRYPDPNLATAMPSQDSLYLSLKLENANAKLIPLKNLLSFSYNQDNGYVTDLAGNRLKTITASSLDRSPPQISMTVAPVANQTYAAETPNEIYIVFTKQLRTETADLAILPSQLELVGVQNASINASVPARLVFSTENSTGVIVSLTGSVTYSDLCNAWVRVKQPTSLSYDAFSGIQVYQVQIFDDTAAANTVEPLHQHIISDFAINVVNPEYAYDNSAMEEGTLDSIYDNLYGTEEWAVRDFSGTTNNEGRLLADKDIDLTASVSGGDGQATPTQSISMFIDINPIAASVSDFYINQTGMNTRLWLPTVHAALNSTANTKATELSQNENPNQNLRQFFIPNNPETLGCLGYPAGSEVQFLYRVDGITRDHDNDVNTPEIPLYAIRLKDERDVSSIDLWSFTLVDMKKQRGGVTILNNVINSLIHEKVIVEVDMPQTGNLTVQVMTLDGNVVKTLNRGQAEKGLHYFRWDGTNLAGNPVARGLYFIRIVGKDIDETRKVLVIKE